MPDVSWLDDFNRYLDTTGDVIDTVQKVTGQPYGGWPDYEPPTTPKQATPDIKTAGAESTDASAKASTSPWLLIVGAIVLVYLLG